MKRPADDVLKRDHGPDAFFLSASDRKHYQAQLEQWYMDHAFGMLTDHQLMEVYEADDRQEALDEYFY